MTTKFVIFDHSSPVNEDLLKEDIEINSLKSSIDSLESRILQKNDRVKKPENQLAYYKRQNRFLLSKLNTSELQTSLGDGINVHKNQLSRYQSISAYCNIKC